MHNPSHISKRLSASGIQNVVWLQVYVSRIEWEYWTADEPDMRNFTMGKEAFQSQVDTAQLVFGAVRPGFVFLCYALEAALVDAMHSRAQFGTV